VISGRQLFVGEGQRPKTLLWCLSMNGASFSKDMAQWSVPITLDRATYSTTWENDTAAFIDERRWDIIGDCLALLQRPGSKLSKCSRSGAWEEAVLSRVAEPGEAQTAIYERQAEVDEDAGEAEEVREAFRAELRLRGV
jgi:hypothetical protein